MTGYSSEHAKLTFNGIEFPMVTDVIYSYDRKNGHREERLLGPSPTGPFTIECTGVLTEEACEFFRWLGWRMFPSVTPDGAVGAACVGVFAWRLLAELQVPLHRRAAMAPFWVKALQSRYVIQVPGQPTAIVDGNTRAVLEVYDRIRREAGDYDAEELGGLN